MYINNIELANICGGDSDRFEENGFITEKAYYTFFVGDKVEVYRSEYFLYTKSATIISATGKAKNAKYLVRYDDTSKADEWVTPDRIEHSEYYFTYKVF